MGYLEDVVEVVGDDYDSQAPIGETAHQVENLTRLRHTQRGSGLVEDDDLGIPHDRFGYCYGLALATRQAGNRLAHRRQCCHRERIERLPARFLHRSLVEPIRPLDLLTAQEHIGDNVEIVGQGQVLVDDLDTESGGIGRSVDLDRLAFKDDLPLVIAVNAGDALYQSGLSGPVVAYESHDLAEPNLEIHLLEGPYRAEVLRNALQLENGLNSIGQRQAPNT